jgi:hypothetical protein
MSRDTSAQRISSPSDVDLSHGNIALVRGTRRNIPEDTILHSHSRENLKSYINALAMGRVQSSYLVPGTYARGITTSEYPISVGKSGVHLLGGQEQTTITIEHDIS